MKAVCAAVMILCTLIVLVTWNSLYVTDGLEQIRTAAALLPDDAEQLGASGEVLLSRCETLSEMWERMFPYLSFVCSYAELNRADEALIELTSGISAGSGENAYAAKRKFEDALRRLCELEGLSLRSVF